MKDLRVRQAMQLAIDLDLLQKRVMRGKSRNAGTLVAPQIPVTMPPSIRRSRPIRRRPSPSLRKQALKASSSTSTAPTLW